MIKKHSRKQEKSERKRKLMKMQMRNKEIFYYFKILWSISQFSGFVCFCIFLYFYLTHPSIRLFIISLIVLIL